jgi:hypothetical protein
MVGALAHQRSAELIARAQHERDVKLATGSRPHRFRLRLPRRHPVGTGSHVVLRPAIAG